MDCKETNYIFAVQFKQDVNCIFGLTGTLLAVMSYELRVIKQTQCGMEQLVARRAHNPKVVGSSPAPATQVMKKPLIERLEAFLRLW